MINISGTLLVEKIQGRFGPFNAAKLKTSVGDFTVERKGFKQLEMYAEGRYEGIFTIGEIFMGHYITNGRLINEIRIRIEEMNITSNVKPFKPDEMSNIIAEEVDPIIEEASDKKVSKTTDNPLQDITPFTVSKPPKQKAQKVTEPHLSQDELDTELFKDEWPLPDIYKQDMSRDRSVIRQQANRLNELGFTLNPQDQTWYRQQG